MKTRIGHSFIPVLVFLACAATPAAAAWSLGSNFGLDLLRSGGDSGVIAVGWPGNSFAYVPGMRIGLAGEHSAEEFYVDSGLLLLSNSGSTFTTVQLAANFQHTFSPDRDASPYLTVGVGFFMIDEGGSSAGYTVPSIGGGIGTRHKISDGHGAFRTEFHVDHLSRSESKGVPGITTIGLKLGFDLWIK